MVFHCSYLMKFLMCPVLTFVASGKINGKGYYIYEKGSKPKPDPSVLSIVEESRKLTNIMPGGKVNRKRGLTKYK